jgi:hypothetical protein
MRYSVAIRNQTGHACRSHYEGIVSVSNLNNKRCCLHIFVNQPNAIYPYFPVVLCSKQNIMYRHALDVPVDQQSCKRNFKHAFVNIVLLLLLLSCDSLLLHSAPFSPDII